MQDCRAYEAVSPPGSEPNFQFVGEAEVGDPRTGDGRAYQVQASVTGEGFSYVTVYPPPNSPSDGEYLRLTRGRDGWSFEQMIPPQSTSNSVICRTAYIAAYSPDLSKAVLADGVGQTGSPVRQGVDRCGTDDPALVSGEPRGFQNLFLGEREAGPYQLIDSLGQAPAGASPTDAWLEAASSDLSHVVFAESAKLTSDANGGFELYEWHDGSIRLVTILPDGTPTQGSLANGYEPEDERFGVGAETFTHAVSADGSRVYFVANGDLYVRLNADQPQSTIDSEGACVDPTDACTLQVDSAQGGSQNGGGQFAWATPEGRTVFFLDDNELTSDSTARPGQPDLYEYELGAPSGARLRDLTAGSVQPADVLGVSGISDDGSDVYFVATGALTGATNSSGDAAVEGEPNLYLRHAGSVAFIATLDTSPNAGDEGRANDRTDWESAVLTTRVTPDGRFLAFNSTKPLTGYDNLDASTGEPDNEIYLYDSAGSSLKCVSCAPAGAPSMAYARLPIPVFDLFGGAAPFTAPGYLQHNLTDDGHVLFNTAQRLLPAATNGLSNVYEYVEGELQLISTGTSSRPSYFYDASPSGDDVFFMSAQELPSGSQASEFKIYDARVDGGFPAPPAAPECNGEGCRSATSPNLPFSAPGTTSQLGVGNLVQSALNPRPAKSRTQVNRERLARALKGCRRKRNKHRRMNCERQARRKYGAKPANHRPPGGRKAKSPASGRGKS